MSWEDYGRGMERASERLERPTPGLEELRELPRTEETWTLVVQVNGKKRGDLQIPSSLDPKQAKDEITALAMDSEAIARFVGDKPPKRVIYVPGRLINVVV